MPNTIGGIPWGNIIPELFQQDRDPQSYEMPRTYRPPLEEEWMTPQGGTPNDMPGTQQTPFMQYPNWARMPMNGMGTGGLVQLAQSQGMTPQQFIQFWMQQEMQRQQQQQGQNPDATLLDRLARWLMGNTEQ